MKQWIPFMLLLCAWSACKKEIAAGEPSAAQIQFIENSSGMQVRDGIVLRDGNLLLYGEMLYGDSGGKDGFLMKQSSDGKTLWTKMYGGVSEDIIRGVCEDDEGNLIVAGYTRSYGVPADYGYVISYYDAWLFKTDSRGNTLWSRSVAADKDVTGTPGLKGYYSDYFYAIANDGKGGYLVGGATDNVLDPVANVVGTSWILRFDASGKCSWSRTIDRDINSGDLISGITKDLSGDLYVLGSGTNIVLLAKLEGASVQSNAKFLNIMTWNTIPTGFGASDIATLGNSIVTFTQKRYGTGSEIRIRYFDHNLNMLNEIRLDSLKQYTFKNAQWIDGALYLSGSYLNNATASLDAFFWKISDTGKLLAQENLQTLSDEQYRGVFTTVEKKLVVIGEAKRKGWNIWSPFRTYWYAK